MATRRHRIVIKPNIRPAPAKPGGTNTPKPKIPSNAVSEPPSPAVRSHQVPLLQDETHQQSVNYEGGKGESAPDTDISNHLSMAAISLSEKDVPATLGGTDSEQKVPSIAKEEKSVSHSQEESSHTKENIRINVEEVSTDDMLGKVTSIATSLTNGGSLPEQQYKHPKSLTPDVENQMLKSKDITDSEGILKDDSEATPSEVDGSCMSDVMSLDPDNERTEEVGDKAKKKRRWHKSKKLRAEPLPSREKSPDRQTMKMSDLLLWNPQQNFLQKKNKKKIPLKNENRPPSPTLSVTTVEDDKESTNQSASLPAPQVMIGPDGSIILNAESLLIQTQKDDSRPKEVLEDDDDDRYLNTNTYRKYKKAKLWTEMETEKFFVGLSMCGTDFSLLTNLLPHRSRRELKNKFHREERRNRDLIDKALSNRQQYDLSPFEKIALKEDKKVKKAVKKQMKTESINAKKAVKAAGKGTKKRKTRESEDEEDDWGPEYDEEDEENQNNGVGNGKSTDVKTNSKVKSEVGPQNKQKPVNQNIPLFVPEDTSTPFLPGYTPPHIPEPQNSLAALVPQFAEYLDLENPRMRNRPSKTYSRIGSKDKPCQQEAAPTAGTVTNFSSSSSIQAIPGSTQVQIEMEGVQNPVQGVLIPSHMVPQIAPQLGIPGNAVGMQVLLVQEETDSGSLVHVYVIPESDTAQGSGDNLHSGISGPVSHPPFSSPIPSPHPTTSIQSPHAMSPFSSTCSPHPLASVCSPHPNSTFQSPPTLHSPPAMQDPPPGDPVQRPPPLQFTSPPR